jgi:alkylation response protein AidB-like acyl-CoA dehydrogenase
MTEDELRGRVRALIAKVDPDQVDMHTFRGAQFDHGLALVNFPEGYGGLGLNPRMQAIVNDELQKTCTTTYDDLVINPIGIGMGMPTLLTYGSDEMKKQLLRRCYTGEDIWCQLFSEPTSQASPRAPSATATSGSSTARRSGRASRTCRAGACCSRAATRTCRSTKVSSTSWST